MLPYQGGRRVQGIRLLLLMVKQVQPIASGCRGYSRSFAWIFHITLLCSSVRIANINRDFLLDQGLICRADENWGRTRGSDLNSERFDSIASRALTLAPRVL